MELITKCQAYQVALQCDKCKEGMMLPTGKGIQLTTMPPVNKFQHRCTKCGKTEYLMRTYPFITYEPLEEPHPREIMEEESDPTSENTIE